MYKNKSNFQHLINNIDRKSFRDSIFNYESGRRAFLSLGKGNIYNWLEKLLPNTRLIVEPKITGSRIGLQYINGKFNKAINYNSEDITKELMMLRSIPKRIPISKRFEIQGILYNTKNTNYINNKTEYLDIEKALCYKNGLKFCAFQIFHCKINHYQALQELKRIDFEIPETQITNYISDFEIYHQCWKEEKLFQNYPTSGIVLKINSRKLQKQLGENNLSIHWAFAIN